MTEEEIKELKYNIIWWKNRYMSLSKRHKELQQRISKAIEYIENHSLYEEEYDYNYEEELELIGIEDSYAKNDLLEILKGGNNE